VQIYNTSEALPNLINPFWMLPLLGLLKVRARDLIGYGLVYFFINFVLVLFLMCFLHARSLMSPTIPSAWGRRRPRRTSFPKHSRAFQGLSSNSNRVVTSQLEADVVKTGACVLEERKCLR